MANDFKPLIKKINDLIKFDRSKRAIGLTMLTKTSDRIFTQGKAEDNAPIGFYSDRYMKVRRKNKWTSSQKVILQATRHMLNDFDLILSGDSWGLGFKNSDHFEKSIHVEDIYKKSIFAHTDEEIKIMTNLFQNEVNRVLNGN